MRLLLRGEIANAFSLCVKSSLDVLERFLEQPGCGFEQEAPGCGLVRARFHQQRCVCEKIYGRRNLAGRLLCRRALLKLGAEDDFLSISYFSAPIGRPGAG